MPKPKRGAPRKRAPKRAEPPAPAAPADLPSLPDLPPPPTGRHSKLTPDLLRWFVAALQGGMFFTRACKLVGVHRSVAYDWLKRGRAANPPASEALYVQFALLVEYAGAAAEYAALTHVRLGLKGWEGPAWYLERRDPKRYGRRQRTELTGADGGSIKHAVEHSADALCDRIEEIAADLFGGPAEGDAPGGAGPDDGGAAPDDPPPPPGGGG